MRCTWCEHGVGEESARTHTHTRKLQVLENCSKEPTTPAEQVFYLLEHTPRSSVERSFAVVFRNAQNEAGPAIVQVATKSS